jgi:hypothetical protein
VQNKTRDILNDTFGPVGATAGAAPTASPTEQPVRTAAPSTAAATNTAQPAETPTATVQPQGSYWTIAIDNTDTLQVESMASATFHLEMNCTHIGETMFGDYSGYMKMSYTGDFSQLTSFAEAAGIELSFDPEGSFSDTGFTLSLSQYDASADALFTHSFTQGPASSAGDISSGGANATLEAMLQNVLSQMASSDEPFEQQSTPDGLWSDWALHYNEGDPAGFNKIAALLGGRLQPENSLFVDTGAIKGTALEKQLNTEYSGQAEISGYAFPYVLRVYGDKNVVLQYYPPAGGPVSMKFYGTITEEG